MDLVRCSFCSRFEGPLVSLSSVTVICAACVTACERTIAGTKPQPQTAAPFRIPGANFRERERIKKKMKRWKGKLERMPELERQALLWAMTAADPLPHAPLPSPAKSPS